jgi:AraC-like DNA-binding protein
MSSRSLRRHLHAEGASFDDLVGGAQTIRAKQLLEDPRCSIQEAAFALGFSTPAAFTRAFKRWTGATPTAYRAR